MLKAYILIQTKPGTSEEVVKGIRERVKEATSVDSVYGRFDAIVVIEAPDIDRINEIVYKVVGKDPNIMHTETSITL